MAIELVDAKDIDRLLLLAPGKARRLAKKGQLPCVRLPDGEIRFELSAVRATVESWRQPATAEVSHAG